MYDMLQLVQASAVRPLREVSELLNSVDFEVILVWQAILPGRRAESRLKARLQPGLAATRRSCGSTSISPAAKLAGATSGVRSLGAGRQETFRY